MTNSTIPKSPAPCTGVNSVRRRKRKKRNRLTKAQKRRKLPELIAKCKMRCFWCKCELTKEVLTIDHYIPLSRGGNNKIKNLRLSCGPCNQRRGNLLPEEMQHLNPGYYPEFEHRNIGG